MPEMLKTAWIRAFPGLERSPRRALVLTLLLCLPGRAGEPDTLEVRPSPFYRLGTHMAESVFGWPLALHATAAGSTWLLLESGVDADGLRFAARQDPLVSGLAYAPGLLASSFAPILLPASLYFFSERGRTAGAVALQAVGIAFLYNNLLKAATGRAPPESDHPHPERLAHGFRFGVLRGGLFNGWPSGHGMVSTALATSLAAYRRDVSWALPAALAYSAYVGACVAFGARGDIHWISDAAAAGLMGFGVGWTVGSGFRRAGDPERAAAPGITVHPLLAGGAAGIRAVARLP